MRIRLAENFRALFYAPFYATTALGFYEAEGVDVELIAMATPGDAVAQLEGGSLDITWGGPMRVMKAADGRGHSPLRCFCEVVARDPFYLIGRPGPQPPFDLARLPALRFAAVSEVPTPWMCLQHDLRERGIDPAGLDRAPDRTMAENYEALRRGEVAVVQTFEPFVSMAARDGTGLALYAASRRGSTVYTTFIATLAGIERHRAGFTAMMRAVGRTQRWLTENPVEDLAEVVAPFFPAIPPDMLVSGLRRYHETGVWSRSVEISPPGFGRLAESLLSGGYISSHPRYEDCVDQTLA